MKKVLVIEDENHIAEGLKLNLKLKGHEVELAENGEIGIDKWKSWQPDLIVLDIMMPIKDGFSVLKEIREVDVRLPILILSAKDQQKDKLKALKGGVDDYLTKPFNLDEFLLKVDRLIEKASWYDKETPKENYCFDNITIDFNTFKATIESPEDGQDSEIHLTDQEITLLTYFIKNEGKAISRSELLEKALGYHEETSSRTIDNFLVRFRKYFEPNPKKPKYFLSIRSVGYFFDPHGEYQGK